MKRKYTILANIILIVLEIVGLIIAKIDNGEINLWYYTEDSNVFALLISCVYLFFLLFKNKVPRIVSFLKYASVLSLTITFLVVILILAPMYNFNYKWLLFSNCMLYYHFLCPIVALISFMLFEKHYKFKNIDIVKSLIPTFIYSIVLIISNLAGKITGPYPFLEVKNNTFIVSLLWFIGLFGFMFGLSMLLIYIKENLINKKKTD